MKLEIDTKRDSVDDIKKTIEFLLKFVQESSPSEISRTPEVGSGTFNMFEDSEVEKKDEDKDDDNPGISIVEY